MQHLIASAGYLAIFLLMLGESACIPIPSELVMPFGGALAAGGHLELVAVILLGTLGNLAGSYIAYAVGRKGGRPAVRRFGRYVRLKEDDLDRAERWFGRYGAPTVFFGRLLPVVRTFISLPAGAADMPALRFGIYTILGSLPWSAGLAVAGYELGSNWRTVDHAVTGATDVVAGLIGATVLAVVYSVYRRRRNRLAADRGSLT